ncbi:acyl-CoA thioesterase [Saccharopolyspora sp. K220]|uniref:acyl-CoA thioesterase n=1 Tax=Saccharopolyspora soli TaxID=2926618 RepID=UPI001F55D63C|nr:thioesterase family protein [Saccharopolyspora soli]MCI2419927.1 acyl-CoA thioesterase [Saccharopolyspora soli]
MTEFTVYREIGTRWHDNDEYGHVNNVEYLSFFDTAVNGWLLEVTETDIRKLRAIGVVAEVSCRYLREVHFPDLLAVGIGLERLGRRSVVYRLGLFLSAELRSARAPAPVATGRFAHVYVDRDTRRPVEVPEKIVTAVRSLTPQNVNSSANR